MKTGLVLEGGAMRGMFTAGVLDDFIGHDLWFDGVIGVSAGAVFGISYVSRQAGRSLRYSKKYNGDKRYMGVGSLIKTGSYVNTEFAYEQLPRKLDYFDDETFQASGIPFYAVVTDLDTGKPDYIPVERGFEQMDVLRASASMPFVSKPVEYQGRRYLDGGVADPIPYEMMRELGYDKLVVVLTREMEYRKEAMNPLMISLFYHKYKGFQTALKQRHEVYNRSVDRLRHLEEKGEVFVIRPAEALQISRLEKRPEELQRVYDIGANEAGRVRNDLIEFLSG